MAITQRFEALPIDADQGFPQAFLLDLQRRIYRLEFHVNIAEALTDWLSDRAARAPGSDEPIDLARLDPWLTAMHEDDKKTDQAATAPPDPSVHGASLQFVVVRQESRGPVELLRRRVVTRLEIAAEELVFYFTELKVHRLNLNGVGAFGSRVRGGVATRWDS